MSSTVNASQLIAKLRAAKPQAHSIQALSRYILMHHEDIETIAEIWESEYEEASSQHKLTLLYIMNDVIQTSKVRFGDVIADSLADYVTRAIRLTATDATDILPKVNRILDVWMQRRIYKPMILNKMTRVVKDALNHTYSSEQNETSNQADNSATTRSTSKAYEGIGPTDSPLNLLKPETEKISNWRNDEQLRSIANANQQVQQSNMMASFGGGKYKSATDILGKIVLDDDLYSRLNAAQEKETLDDDTAESKKAHNAENVDATQHDVIDVKSLSAQVQAKSQVNLDESKQELKSVQVADLQSTLERRSQQLQRQLEAQKRLKSNIETFLQSMSSPNEKVQALIRECLTAQHGQFEIDTTGEEDIQKTVETLKEAINDRMEFAEESEDITIESARKKGWDVDGEYATTPLDTFEQTTTITEAPVEYADNQTDTYSNVPLQDATSFQQYDTTYSTGSGETQTAIPGSNNPYGYYYGNTDYSYPQQYYDSNYIHSVQQSQSGYYNGDPQYATDAQYGQYYANPAIANSASYGQQQYNNPYGNVNNMPPSSQASQGGWQPHGSRAYY